MTGSCSFFLTGLKYLEITVSSNKPFYAFNAKREVNWPSRVAGSQNVFAEC